MSDDRFYISDALRAYLSDEDIPSLIRSTRQLCRVLRVPLAKFREWSSVGFGGDSVGQLKVLRGLLCCFPGSRLGVIGRTSFGLSYGDFMLTLNRYEFIVMCGREVYFRFSSDNFSAYYLLPFVLGFGVYGYSEGGELCMRKWC